MREQLAVVELISQTESTEKSKDNLRKNNERNVPTIKEVAFRAARNQKLVHGNLADRLGNKNTEDLIAALTNVNMDETTSVFGLERIITGEFENRQNRNGRNAVDVTLEVAKNHRP